jgi:hypothetical protein
MRRAPSSPTSLPCSVLPYLAPGALRRAPSTGARWATMRPKSRCWRRLPAPPWPLAPRTADCRAAGRLPHAALDGNAPHALRLARAARSPAPTPPGPIEENITATPSPGPCRLPFSSSRQVLLVAAAVGLMAAGDALVDASLPAMGGEAATSLGKDIRQYFRCSELGA